MTIDNTQVHSALRQPSKSVTGKEERLSHCPCGKMADLGPKGKLSAGTSSWANTRDLVSNSTFNYTFFFFFYSTDRYITCNDITIWW